MEPYMRLKGNFRWGDSDVFAGTSFLFKEALVPDQNNSQYADRSTAGVFDTMAPLFKKRGIYRRRGRVDKLIQAFISRHIA